MISFFIYESDSQNLSPILRFVQLLIIRNEQCTEVYGPFIFPTNICAAGSRNGRPTSSCNGNVFNVLVNMIDNSVHYSQVTVVLVFQHT